MRYALTTLMLGGLLAAVDAPAPAPLVEADASRPAPVAAREATDPAPLGPDRHVTHATERIPWGDGPASLQPGARMAILEGDPAAEGIFTIRLELPDGFRIDPHWHPMHERLTVLSGTFHLGHGERFDRDAARALPAGSYTVMPPGMRHFALAEGRTVVQLTGMGPWEIHYINPQDDPRN